MSTRSFIAIQNADNTITGVYCHFDGYPEGVGATLTKHYTSSDLVRQLVDLGGLSSLGDTLTETVAYHRDRGEEKEDASYSSYDDMIQNVWLDFGADYAYVWDGTAWSSHNLER